MAFIGLGLNEGAYLAEIMRAGLLSVSREGPVGVGRHRAGNAARNVFRRIILPQAMRVIVPPIGNETISMLKTTSLVSAIPFTLELHVHCASAWPGDIRSRAALIAAAIWYLVITRSPDVDPVLHREVLRQGLRAPRQRRHPLPATSSSSDEDDDLRATKLKFLDVTP